MKVKELIERVQSLDPNLEVYITNIEETQLTQIDVVIPCVRCGNIGDDYGFVTIFPKTIPNNSNLEKLEHLNLSQDTANCDKFTLTAEEVEIVENALKSLRRIIVETYGMVPELEPSLRASRIRVDNILERIKEYKDENNKTDW